ncbi:MAG TPA: ParA family protein [Thermoflexia bacterium]|nr:ParA family protein [Thermoflexia bacterium]
MRIILTGPEEGELTGAAYPAFIVAGVEVAAVATAPETLAELAGALPDAVAVVQAEVYPTPEAAVEGLGALPCRVAVVLPTWWEGERDRFASLPNLVAGFTAPVSWAQVAAEVKTRAQRGRGTGKRGSGEARKSGHTKVEKPRLRANTPAPGGAQGLRANTQPAGGRVVALWSGPAGGVGKTTLALLLVGYAAERRVRADGCPLLLLALAEPSVSARLALPRVPNVTAFFETEDLARAVQTVGWEAGPTLPVVLGPARPREGAVERERVAALVEAAASAYPVVVADLPALPPGGNVWSLEPLLHARAVVLVAAPSAAGVAAVVESLATLRDIGASAGVHLVINRRVASGLPLREFVEGVRSLWGECPPVAAEVPYSPELAALDRGEWPEGVGSNGRSTLREAVEALTRAVLWPWSIVEAQEVASRPRRRLGRLISVEVVD